MIAPIRLTASERYGADGGLTPAGKEAHSRENLRELSKLFAPGDIVFDEEHPDVLGIVTECAERGIRVVFEHGGGAAGPGLLPAFRHREPRVNVPVPAGSLGNRGWNREQAVKAALRRAGVR